MIFSLFWQPETVDFGNVVAETLRYLVDIFCRQRMVKDFLLEGFDCLLADAFPILTVKVVITAVMVIAVHAEIALAVHIPGHAVQL